MRSFKPSRPAFRAVGILCLAGIAFATLSPIGLRPHIAGLQIEHVGAFCVAGLLLGLAYPRHLLAVGLGLVVCAVALEGAQHLVPGRHGRMIDLAMKMAGSGLGIAFAAAFDPVLRFVNRSTRTGSSAS
ncbi:hypothetical protein [Aureimonas sp. Leaf454]|uniref:hypothetical protein n=1 Tax=Aureimonas sp. Leaf454 TaxID=1736381 RepID=UPI0009E8AC66|nr:hypothetical protein [Aureimonas sp. Leaf454]